MLNHGFMIEEVASLMGDGDGLPLMPQFTKHTCVCKILWQGGNRVLRYTAFLLVI